MKKLMNIYIMLIVVNTILLLTLFFCSNLGFINVVCVTSMIYSTVALLLGTLYINFLIILALLKKPVFKPNTHFIVVMSPCLFVIIIFFQAFMMAGVMNMKSRQHVRSILSDIDPKKVEIKIGGIETKYRDDWFNAIKCIRIGTGSHSHSEDEQEFVISDSESTLVLKIGRDSDRDDEFWVFYPKYYATKNNEIGRFRSDILRINTKLLAGIESYKSIEEIIGYFIEQGYSGTHTGYDYKADKIKRPARFDEIVVEKFKHLGFKGEACFKFFRNRLYCIEYSIHEDELEGYIAILKDKLEINLSDENQFETTCSLKTLISKNGNTFVWFDKYFSTEINVYTKYYTEGEYDHDPPVEFHP